MKISLTLIFQFFVLSLLAQHQEKAPNSQNPNLPVWVQMMYAENPNPDEVKTAYEEFYKNHDFVKNGHTQYYKHWLRNLTRDKNGIFSKSKTFKNVKKQESKYLQKIANQKANRSPTSSWECIGPYDWDHDAAERSYAPGAAHIYTIAKAPSDANVLYAGTATSGVFKSTDNGLTWNLVTKDYLVNEVYTIAIDPNDEDIVFFNGEGETYKTTDGGSTWSLAGDVTFQASPHYGNELVAHPTNSLIYFLCAEDGLYRTIDGGANWTKIKGGEFQELEFHPTNSNQLYAIQQLNNRTYFYKSTDEGSTWVLKPNGWPGVASFSSTTFDGIDMGGATTDYVNFASDPEPGNPSMQDFSIELRVKTNGWTSDPAIFSNKNWGNGFNKGFVLAGRTNGAGWKFNIGDGTSRIDLDGGSINDGTWHQLVVTYDYDGTKSVYQDGVLINSTSNSITDNVTNVNNDLALCQDGTFNYGTGIDIEISDVRIWNTVLAANTIESWYCQTLTNSHPNYSDLIHHWKCDDGAGSSLADAIGGNTGTINGSSTWTTNNTMVCTTSSLGNGEEQRRTEIAVTADEPDYIYALATGDVNGGEGLFGVYKSTDGGESWNFTCCGAQPGGPAQAVTNINMMGWQDDGSDDGGQYYYDLALEVSPTDANKIHVAGVNHWVSTDGGVSFTCPAKWSHPAKPEYVHADIHDISYFGSELWIACDGGVFYSTDGGANISKRMVGIEGTDFWGFGGGFSNGDVLLGGTYHNGTLLKDNNVYLNDWLSTRGGDNYRGFVNFADNSIVYDDGGKRKLSGDRTVNFEEYSFAMEPNASFLIGENSSIEFNPRNPNISYTGVETSIWKTEDDGVNFIQIYNFGSGNSLGEIRVAPSDPNIIYAATFGGSDKVWRSIDAGNSWTEITPGSTSVPYSISVDGEDANILWAARTVSYTSQGTLNGAKVYKSTNGGTSWTNISGTALNDEYLTNIVHQKGTNGGIYVGTRRAVYYKNNTMPDFVLFNNDLPASTFSTRLIVNYQDGKLFNGTNRSAYKVDFYEPSSPIAQIAAEEFSTFCSGDKIQFFSNSAALNSASYSWSFPTGTPSTSNLKNPLVSFNTLGAHEVTLTVTDANGSDSQTLTNFITIDNNCSPETTPGLSLSTDGTSNSYIYAPDNESLDFGSTTDFTLTAWVKTTSNSSDAVIMAKKDWDTGSNNGWVMAIENGELWINVGDGSNRIDLRPDDLVNDGKWHHVAASFNRNGLAIVYLDGKNIASINMSSVGNIDNSKQFTIGADDEADYPLEAFIDEVCIYNAALSQSEIREQRHLTKDLSTSNLVTYIQFNEISGAAFDRAGGKNHCTFSALATRTTSTSPVGGGASQTLDCSTGGIKSFSNADLTMEFPNTGTYPNGDIVVSRLDLNPDQNPNAFPVSPSYWVINNYGTNSTFTELTNIVFEDIGNVVPTNTADQYKLYKRNSNQTGNTWGNYIDFADVITTGANGSATFSTDNGITSFSQFILTTEGTVLPIELLQFSVYLNDLKEVKLDWVTGSELDNDYFIIEKSRDGITFLPLDKIESKGDSNENQYYESVDKKPFNGISYYRLKQVDLDGQFTYSLIKSITINALKDDIIVYPNPIKSSQFLNIKSYLEEDFEVIINDASGKTLKTEWINNGNGQISLSELPSGFYFYKIKGNTFLKNGVIVVD